MHQWTNEGALCSTQRQSIATQTGPDKAVKAGQTFVCARHQFHIGLGSRQHCRPPIVLALELLQMLALTFYLSGVNDAAMLGAREGPNIGSRPQPIADRACLAMTFNLGMVRGLDPPKGVVNKSKRLLWIC